MGLFQDNHNKPIGALLYIILTWHGLAKLRLHTELTLTLLKKATVRLGQEMRNFQKNICPHYDTKETSKETQSRVRNEARREGAAQASTSAPSKTTSSVVQNSSGARKAYTFKLTKPKFHFIGDYVPEIEYSGTTDNYSTQIVRILFSCESLTVTKAAVPPQGEHEHRRAKGRYRSTSKINATGQLVKIDAYDNEIFLKGLLLEARGEPLLVNGDTRTRTARAGEGTADVGIHWVIGKDEKHKVMLHPWLSNNSSEPACKVS